MTALIVEDISLQFDRTNILSNVSFILQSNETACLLGGSGCGKTTLLRVIAGLEQAYSGSIHLNGKCLLSKNTYVDANLRKIGFVFQDYALFPHLTVAQNIAFGLNKDGKHKEQLQNMLALVELESYANKYPHQLSGGQQQRVAIARALAPKPQLLLLDEPFAHLDVHLREQLAVDLRHLLKQQDIMALMVTHDQQEAFAFADYIGVIHDGKLEQWGSPAEIYQSPQSRYVANFIGEGTVLQKRLLPASIQQQLPENIAANQDILFRPEAFELVEQSDTAITIEYSTFRGSYQSVYCTLAETQAKIMLHRPNHETVVAGDKIFIQLNPKHVHSLV